MIDSSTTEISSVSPLIFTILSSSLEISVSLVGYERSETAPKVPSGLLIDGSY